jgi:hypothetical protein
MIHFSLEQGSGLWVLLAVAAAAILAMGLGYRRAFGALGRRRWQVLFGLRAAAVVLVVLLLFRPVFSYQKELAKRPSLLFLVDRSASMGIADDPAGQTRFEQARQQIEKWRPKPEKDFDLRAIAFAEDAQPLKSLEELHSLQPDGKSTSISRALAAASQLAPPSSVEAAILLSDGLHNSARSPLEIAGKLGIIVHTVGIGASLRSNASYRDIQVTGIDCPDRLLLGNTAA